MEDLGVAPVGPGRRLRLTRLNEWAWADPNVSPFILFVAAEASQDAEVEIRRFAVEAVDAGCAYLCAWGEGCSFVHDMFDLASIDANRFVLSSWHSDEALSDALWFALCDAWPDEDEFPSAAAAAVVLAVEELWLAEVRRLVADPERLTRLALGDDS